MLKKEQTVTKKKFAFIITYACVAFLGGLGLMLLLLAEKSPRASEKENRMLAGFPEFSIASVADGSFMTGLEAYLSDAMFDRDGIVDATSRISAVFSVGVTEDSVEDDVAAFASEDAGEDDTESAAQAETGLITPAVTEETQTQAAMQAVSAAAEPQASDTLNTSEAPEATEAAEEGVTEEPADEIPAEKAEEDESAESDPYAVDEEYNPYDTAVDAEGWRVGAFWQKRPDGSMRTVYKFPIENLKNAAKVLNAYRAILPKDGKMFFAQIPFKGTGMGLMQGTYTGWGCDIEELLGTHVDDGVVIVSATDVLEEHLLNGEYLYFHTDHHWTPRAASYLASAFLATQGITSYAYEDYRYSVYHNFYGSYGSTAAKRDGLSPDDLDVLIPMLPTESYTIDSRGTEKQSRFMVERSSYLAYLGGTQGPWRRFASGAHTGRSCLVIGDSYSNCFIPYLMPYYDNVFSVDMRTAYFSKAKAGCTVTEFVAKYGISDIYFIPSTASSINSGYMLSHLWKYL